ncbi:MAG TPA: acyl-CoA dehydrogenase family protein [Candidatus Nitrosotenuis sp.]|nr:acyl-CoA dehydrogenase family protein [Candidatus Nitrosotenuis sp.]
MNFEISEKQKNFLNKVDRVCRSIRESEEKSYIQEKLNDKVIPEFVKIGMLGCPISTKYGGLGYDILTYAMALERIGQEGNSLRTFFSAHVSIGQMVLQSWANDEQKKEYLPKTTSGKSIMGFALTEPAAGSDPASMQTRFEESGENFILKGKKHWVGNGTFAKLITTFAKDSDGKISAFLVDTDSKGFKAKEMKNKMGLLTVKNAEITLDDCVVPKKNLLGIRGQGLSIAYSTLIDGRLSVASGAVGVMKDCLEESVSYSKSRKQHGTELAKKQLIQEHIAKIAINMESSKWLVYRTAHARQKLHDYAEKFKGKTDRWQLNLNRDNKQYSELRAEADNLTSIAKFHASNSAFDSANRAVQIFGSEGYKKTTRVAKHFLDSRAIIIYEGANEVLELKIAAHILGDKYRAY